MVLVKYVLCPVDLWQFCAQALRYATPLTRWWDPSLTVLFVTTTVADSLLGEARDPESVSSILEKFATEALEPVAARLVERTCTPSAEIVRLASDLRVD
jgi:hypothetical protein